MYSNLCKFDRCLDSAEGVQITAEISKMGSMSPKANLFSGGEKENNSKPFWKTFSLQVTVKTYLKSSSSLTW